DGCSDERLCCMRGFRVDDDFGWLALRIHVDLQDDRALLVVLDGFGRVERVVTTACDHDHVWLTVVGTRRLVFRSPDTDRYPCPVIVRLAVDSFRVEFPVRCGSCCRVDQGL